MHDLATTNGKAAMMFTGETPWHKLGTTLDEPATAAEAIGAAGLNYQVDLRSIETDDGIRIPQRKAVIRTDSQDVLGVVGTSYSPVQNHQCFEFLDSVVQDGQLRYHTAGALGKGEKVCMLAKLDGEIRIKNSEDVTDKFLLLSNSHDGRRLADSSWSFQNVNHPLQDGPLPGGAIGKRKSVLNEERAGDPARS